MNHIKTIVLIKIILIIQIVDLDFAQANFYSTPNITEKFKVYDKTMGSDEGWTLAKYKKGIKVYHKKIDITPIKVFKGVAELEIDLTTLVAFLMDVHKFPSWIVMCDSAEVLKSTGEYVNEIDQLVYCVYTVNRPPWPVKPRDNVIYAVATQDAETLTLRVKGLALPEHIPHKKGFVRCPLLMMEWKFMPLDNGNLEFTFETVVDVGGLIPDWVINVYSVYIPYMTIQNIRKQMPFEEKYKQKKIKWLKVPPSKGTGSYLE